MKNIIISIYIIIIYNNIIIYNIYIIYIIYIYMKYIYIYIYEKTMALNVQTQKKTDIILLYI